MLYFDRMSEEHFGSIRQQVWSFLHFPLHIVLVLVLQGISLLIIWRQAVESVNALETNWVPALNYLDTGFTYDPSTYFGSYMAEADNTWSNGTAFAHYMNDTCYSDVFDYIPKGVDASKEIKIVATAFKDIKDGLDYWQKAVSTGKSNETAILQLWDGMNSMTAATYKTLFDTFSVTVAKRKVLKAGAKDYQITQLQYYQIFDLIMSYTFIAVSLLLFLEYSWSTC